MGEIMKALVKSKAQPGLWLEEVPKPIYKDNEILIKVKKASICGTDVHIYKWDEWSQKNIRPPVVLGHEFMGEVAEIGSHVQGFKVGDKVSAEGHLTCNICRNCLRGKRHLCVKTIGLGIHRDGAFAEYVVIPENNTFLLDPAIPEDVATFLDPLGNATHTALCYDLVGEDVLITGAGPIGCMAAAIAAHVGARNVVVTDINDDRLKLAKAMGATRCVNVAKESLKDVFAPLGIKYGFDVIMEMSGSPAALNTLLDVAMHGANVALLGIPPEDTSINWHHVIFKGITIKGIYGREIFETWYKMSSMLQSGLDVSQIITHHFPMEEYEKGFEAMISGKSGKVILDWEARK